MKIISKVSQRIQRVNELLKEEIGRILLRELDVKDALVTITRVAASENLQQARVFVSVMPETKTKDVLEGLRRNIYDIQKRLNKRLNMRPVPKLLFVEEESVKDASRIEEILENIEEQD